MNIRERKITFSCLGVKPNPNPGAMDLCETLVSFNTQLFLLGPKACPFYSSEAPFFIVGFSPFSPSLSRKFAPDFFPLVFLPVFSSISASISHGSSLLLPSCPQFFFVTFFPPPLKLSLLSLVLAVQKKKPPAAAVFSSLLYGTQSS